jgi:hypothetical protein
MHADLTVGKHHLYPVAALVYGFSAVRIQKESVQPLSAQKVEDLKVEDCAEDEFEIIAMRREDESEKEPDNTKPDDILDVADAVESPPTPVQEDPVEENAEEPVSSSRESLRLNLFKEPTEVELYQSSECTSSLNVNEAKPTMYTYDHPELENRFSTLSATSYATYLDEEELEDEPPDLEYTYTADLSEADAEIARFMHGWDFVKRGSLLQPYPNCPNICVPAPSLNQKVQVRQVNAVVLVLCMI